MLEIESAGFAEAKIRALRKACRELKLLKIGTVSGREGLDDKKLESLVVHWGQTVRNFNDVERQVTFPLTSEFQQ